MNTILIRAFLMPGIIFVAFLFGFSENAKAADAQRTQEMISDIEVTAKIGLDAFDKILKSKSMEKKDTVTAWEEMNEKYFARFQHIAYIEFESTLKGQNDSQASKAREWAQNISTFFDNIQACGDVANWQRKINIEIYSLEADTELAPKWIEANLSSAKDHSRYLTSVAQEIKSGSLSSADIQKRLDEVKKIRNDMENISNSLVRRVEYLEKEHAMKAEMDKKIAAILANWTDMQVLLPNVNAELTAVPSTWVPLVKKHWESFKDVKKKFDEAYGFLIDGTFFNDIAFFKDKKYSEIAVPVIEVEMDLKTQLVSKTQKEKSEEELRKEIALDEELTKKERARLLEISRISSPEKERELKLACARAAGGATGVRNLMLVLAENPEDSSAYKNAMNDLNLIEKNLHPEQIAAMKALNDFYAEGKKCDPEWQKIMKDHAERKKKLGLKNEFDF
jgi:hypothetical protein